MLKHLDPPNVILWLCFSVCLHWDALMTIRFPIVFVVNTNSKLL